MKRNYLLVILIMLISLTACSSKPIGPTPRPKPTEGIPVITDPAAPIQVNAGDEFSITVDSEGNKTGLHWEIAVELETAIVDYVWKDFVPKGDNPDSSGWDIWTFKAIAPGETTITLADYRGMTEDISRKIVFKVIVK